MAHGNAGSSQFRLASPQRVLATNDPGPTHSSSVNDVVLSNAANSANAAGGTEEPSVVVTPSKNRNISAKQVVTETASLPTTEPTPSNSSGTNPGRKRLKRGGPYGCTVSDLNSAARTLALSLAKVVRNASNPDVTREALQILGVSDSGKELEDTLYGCAVAQMNVAAVKSQGSRTADQVANFEHIPAGSPMDKELQDLAKEAQKLVGGVLGLTSSALKEPECGSLIATAKNSD